MLSPSNILFSAAVSVITTVFLPDRANRDISEEPAYGNRGRAGRRKLKIGAGPCGGGGSVLYTHDDAIILIINWLFRACTARFGPAVKFRCQLPADPTRFRCRPVCSDSSQPFDRKKVFNVSAALFGAEMHFLPALRDMCRRLARRSPSRDRDLRSGICAVGADLP